MKNRRHTADRKLKKLKESLKSMGSVLIAYSGGADSTFLLKIARDILGCNVYAVIAESPLYPPSEIRSAVEIAEKLKVKYRIIKTDEPKNPGFLSNSTSRCYFCKKKLFSCLKKIARSRKLDHVLDGSNFDDLKDFRPGNKAKAELGIKSPLEKAGFTKKDIRILSKKLKLPTWNKPSLACLASRFPYGTPLNKADLGRVNSAEDFLHGLGFRQVRVRHYNISHNSACRGRMARLEFLPSDIKKVLNSGTKKKIIFKLTRLGYIYITIDLEGYRTGSMNKFLENKRV